MILDAGHSSAGAPPTQADLPPLRVLVLVSEPLVEETGDAMTPVRPVRAAEFRRQIERELARAEARFAWRVEPAILSRVMDAALRGYNFVVFFGHGTEGSLLFEDERGRAVHVEPERLSGVLTLQGKLPALHALVLCACHSESVVPHGTNQLANNIVVVDHSKPLLVPVGLSMVRGLIHATALGLDFGTAFSAGKEAAYASLAEQGVLEKEAKEQIERLALLQNQAALVQALEPAPGIPLRDQPRFHSGATAPSPVFVGRVEERAWVLDSLRRNRLTTLTGVGGLGKTQIALAIAEHVAVRRFYRDGVVEVGIDTLADPDDLLLRVASSLGLDAAPNRVVEALEDREALVVLDNAESFFSYPAGDAPRRARAALRQAVERCSGLRWLATSREELGLAPWESSRRIGPLALEEARTLFVQTATACSPVGLGTSDDLASILRFADGYPLALVLLARHLAVRSLADLKQSMERGGSPMAEFIERGEPAGRSNSVTACLDLTYEYLHSRGDAESQAALRLLAAVASFPTGLDSEVLRLIVGSETASKGSRDAALLMESRGRRLRLLEPVREYLRPKIANVDREGVFRAAIPAYAALLSGLTKAGLSAEALASSRLEAPNVLALLVAARMVAGAESGPLVREIPGFAQFVRIAGIPQEGRSILTRTIELPEVSNGPLHAQCMECLGHAHRALSELPQARSRYEEALPIYKAIGARLGEANSLQSVGDVHRDLSELPEARGRYEEALPIYKAIGDRLGEANCIQGLGHVHRAFSELPQARRHYEEAIPIYKAIGDRLGEGNCIWSLGDVHREVSELPQARGRYEQALPIYKAIGDRHGEANCIKSLGDVHLALSELPQARGRYEEALTIYKAIGNRLGEANCIQCLGDVHRAVSELSQVRGRYEEALLIYKAIGDRLGEANCIKSLGDVHRALPELPQARGRYEEALPIFKAIGDRLGEAACLVGVGTILAESGDLATARSMYGRAGSIYEEIGVPTEMASVHDNLGRLCLREGKLDDAAKAFANALVVAVKGLAIRNARVALEDLLDVLYRAPSLSSTPASVGLVVGEACLRDDFLAVVLRVSTDTLVQGGHDRTGTLWRVAELFRTELNGVEVPPQEPVRRRRHILQVYFKTLTHIVSGSLDDAKQAAEALSGLIGSNEVTQALHKICAGTPR